MNTDLNLFSRLRINDDISPSPHIPSSTGDKLNFIWNSLRFVMTKSVQQIIKKFSTFCETQQQQLSPLGHM